MTRLHAHPPLSRSPFVTFITICRALARRAWRSGNRVPPGITAAAILILSISCGSPKTEHKDAPVFLIVVDTLRSDRLPIYGYADGKTPAIDALATDSVLFKYSYAHTPQTLPSHASIMTGNLPSTTGVRDNIGFYLNDEQVTLAERLKERGYRTGAAVSTMVLRRGTGIHQGFDTYDDDMEVTSRDTARTYAQRRGDQTLNLAIAWLDAQHTPEASAPLFYFLHLYDPHSPYDAPEPFSSMGKDAYDGEIAFADHLIGRFIEELKKRDLYDKSVIIVTSDHGEGLGDHGEAEHGLLVYREALQVPLLVKLPNSEDGGTVREEATGLFDLAPTIADLLGFSIDCDGVSLFSNEGRDAKRDIYSESLNAELHYGWHRLQSVIQRENHYIRGADEQLFHLFEDPAEKANRFGQAAIPPTALALIERLGTGNQEQTQISEEDIALLESLGYSGGFQVGETIKQLSEKQFLELYDNISRSGGLLNNGQFEQAEQLLGAVVQQYPEMVDARLLLGSALTGLEKYDKAEYLYAETLAMSPRNLSAMTGLVDASLGLGKVQETRGLVDKIMNQEPRMGAQTLLPVLLKHRAFEAAEGIAKAQLARDSAFGMGHYAVGRAHLDRNELAPATTHLEKARELLKDGVTPKLSADLAFFLGDSLARQSEPQRALSLFESALREYPNHRGANASQALLLFSLRKPREALRGLDSWLKTYPEPANFQKAAEVLDIVGIKDEAARLRKKAGAESP